MAWRCSGRTNAELIANMRKSNIISNDRVAEAMSKVDRANYVPHPSSAYHDAPQLIGHSATISAPHMHAYAASHLLPFLTPTTHVLDVGSGSGYLTAVLHHLVGPGGVVVGVEHIPELVKWSKENLRKDGLGGALDRGEIRVVVGDGREGFVGEAPYAAIHVGAAAPTIPQPLIDQLASPGRMFIPVGTEMQFVEHVDKDDKGQVRREEVMGVSYVPLTDKARQTGQID